MELYINICECVVMLQVTALLHPRILPLIEWLLELAMNKFFIAMVASSETWKVQVIYNALLGINFNNNLEKMQVNFRSNSKRLRNF